MASHSYSNEVRSGLFIVIALIVLLVGLFSVGGYKPEGSTYFAYASFSSVGNLTSKSVVKYEGVPVGKVRAIQLSPKDNSIVVTMEIESTFRPRKGDIARITASGFLGTDYIGIKRCPRQKGEALGPVLEPGKDGVMWIPSQEPLDMFAALGSLKAMIDDNKDSVGIIVERVRQTVDNDTFVGDIHQTVSNAKSAAARIDAAAANANSLITNANGMISENRPTLKQTIAHARDVAAGAKGIVEENRPVIRETIAHASDAAAGAKGIVEENRPVIKETIANAKQATGDAKEILARNKASINETVDNLNVTMKNARVFSYAIAEKPWRLVWKDRKREKALCEGDTTVIQKSNF